MKDQDRTILICQGRCCRKDGSKSVLRAFQSQAEPGENIMACGCLGKCGNGPNVLVLPNKIWHQQVYPQDITLILSQS